MRHRIRNPLAAALGLALATASAADSGVPPPFEARYELRKGPLTLGEARLTFERPGGDRYRYRMHTRPVGLTRLLYSAEVRELSEGRIVDDGFRPERYRYDRRGGDRAREAELRFDWAAGKVTNDVGDHPWRMAITGDTLDRVVSPLQLMHDLEVRGTGSRLTYRIADGGELKTYRLEVEARETVRVPAGRFEALRIVRYDTDSDRETRLWCAPELGYLAVQVEQWEDGDRSFRLVLAELEGIDYERPPEPPGRDDPVRYGFGG